MEIETYLLDAPDWFRAAFLDDEIEFTLELSLPLGIV
jgi:hypothetical protein